MRKIEQEMNQAIRTRRNWTGGNTAVRIGEDGRARVYLHGNLIAIAGYAADPVTAPAPWTAHAVAETFRDWPTRTTASRLRALGIDAHIMNGQACIRNRPV